MDQSNDCILSARVGRGPGSTVFLARPLIKSGLAKSKSPFDPKHRLTDTTPPFVFQSAAVRVVGGRGGGDESPHAGEADADYQPEGGAPGHRRGRVVARQV